MFGAMTLMMYVMFMSVAAPQGVRNEG